MKQFTLQLNSGYQRPIVELKTWHNVEALLDTGAFFPIWTADEKILEKAGGVLERILNLVVLVEKQLETCIV